MPMKFSDSIEYWARRYVSRNPAELKIIHNISWPHAKIFACLIVFQILCIDVIPAIWFETYENQQLLKFFMLNRIENPTFYLISLGLVVWSLFSYILFYCTIKYNICLSFGGYVYDEIYWSKKHKIHYFDTIATGVFVFIPAIFFPVFGLISAIQPKLLQ